MQVYVDISYLVAGGEEIIADSLMSDKEKLLFILAVSERMQELINRYCPYDKGNLKKSLSVKETQTGVIFSYSVPYAPYVHEILYRHHKRPTRAKWLVEALRQSLKELILEFENENIPSFNVVFSTTPVLELELTTANNGLNWRDFV